MVLKELQRKNLPLEKLSVQEIRSFVFLYQINARKYSYCPQKDASVVPWGFVFCRSVFLVFSAEEVPCSG